MSNKDIVKKDDKGLVALVAEKREALRNFRFGGAQRNVRQARQDKKDIARALTELNTRAKQSANDSQN